MSRREPERPGLRINLADPGRGPAPLRPRRSAGIYLRSLALVALIAATGFGLFVARGPIGSAVVVAGDGIGDAAAASVDVWRDWSRSLQDMADEIQAATATTTAPPLDPALSKSVLIVIGSDRSDAAFALLARSPADAVRLYMLPQPLLMLAPGYGDFTLAEILEFGGPGLVELSIANEMGIRVDEVLQLPGGLAAMAEELVVDVPVGLFVEESGGGRRLIAAGRQRLSMDLVTSLVTRPGDGDQFDWLRRQAAVWNGALQAIAGDGGAADRLVAGVGADPEIPEMLRSLAAAPEVDTPPIDRVAVSATRDVLRVAGNAFVIEELGHLLLRAGVRPRVEVLNGTGVAGVTAPVAAELVQAGFFVMRTGNAAAFDYETTRVVAQGAPSETVAREAAELIGAGEITVELQAPSGVVDVSIIVGTDMSTREG